MHKLNAPTVISDCIAMKTMDVEENGLSITYPPSGRLEYAAITELRRDRQGFCFAEASCRKFVTGSRKIIWRA